MAASEVSGAGAGRTDLAPSPSISPVVLAGLFVAALVVFTYFYYLSPYRPGVLYPQGYWAWVDQSSYLKEARILASGHLPTRANYLYGLGYSALAVPMIKLGVKGDPFVVPDALIFGATVVMTAVIGARLRSPGFGVAAAAAVAVATPLLTYTVVPWNASVTLLGVMVALLYATSKRRLTWGDGVLIGAVAGLTFAARYVDIVFVGLIAAIALLRRANWRALITTGVTAGAIVGVVLLTHVLILGGILKTPYDQHLEAGAGQVTDQNLSSYSIARAPRVFLDTILDGTYQGKRQAADPLLGAFPWAVLVVPGAVLVARRRSRLRVPVLVALLVSMVASAFYLTFRGATGAFLIFNDVRYYQPWFPLWGLLGGYAVAALADAAGRRRRPPGVAGTAAAAPSDTSAHLPEGVSV